MKILCIIPARYGAMRFPGKPMADIGGKTMIERVYTQCRKAQQPTEVIVATEDARIQAHVQAFGGKAAMTSPDHISGTERIAEVAAQYPDYDYYVNVQGDEPFINPDAIDLLCQTLTQPSVEIATLVKPWDAADDLDNPNMVKAVLDHAGNALYFSRSPIPFVRGVDDRHTWLSHAPFYKHLGIYGFKREVLLAVPSMKPSPLEIESLEQLRWLANGYKIRTATTLHDSIAIDTPADLTRALAWLAANPDSANRHSPSLF